MTRVPFIASTPAPLLLAVALAFACAPDARAQAAADDVIPPAHVSYVEGRVLLDREGGTEDAQEATPLVPGDRVRTEEGRAEILFGDGSLVQLDAGTTLDLLSDARLRLLAGRVALVATAAQAGRLQVDTPEGSADIAAAGEYRVALLDDAGRALMELSVVRGAAGLASDRDRVVVDAGERSWARSGEAPALPVRFNAASFDAFDRWALDRAAMRRGTPSAQYVPATLRSYSGVLDTYGSWDFEPTYGYVWYPRVAAGWRPYYSGRWRYYGHYGWTWTGGGAWGWPTHHYGRWGFSNAGAWFWIPGAQWGPAWVSWAVSTDYVSWCPIGYDNRPVLGFHGYGGHGGYDRHRGHDPWHAWTVVPRPQFGGYRVVSGIAVDGRQFAGGGSRAPLVPQDRAPGPPRRYAADRGANGLGVAVPRGSAGAASVPGGTGSRRFATAPTPANGASTGIVPRALPRSSSYTAGSAAPADGGRAGLRANPLTERTPEDASRVRRPLPAAPRSGYATRLPGDLGARTPGGYATRPDATAPPAAGSMPPGARGGYASPRTDVTRGWRADQVPVHRGMSVEPGAVTVAPGARSSAPAPGTWRGPGMRDPSSGGYARPQAGPWTAPDAAVRRGGGVPDAPRPAAPSPQYFRPAVGAPPAVAPPPAAAAPRQAPSGERGGGSAVPRGGPPPSRPR